MQIDGSTRIVGVFGAPIAHTASPAMHNAAFAALKLNWVYLAFHVEPVNLPAALEGVRTMGMAGVNLTVPHKILALDHLDEIDHETRQLGAVNTIVVNSGKLSGFNTDGYGIVKALVEEFNLTLAGKRVLVLGAGGAGRAIAVKAALERAAAVNVANRTLSRTEPIAAELGRLGVKCRSVRLRIEDLAKIMPEVDVIINATSVGLKPGDSLGLDQKLFQQRHYVYDTIYKPAATEFLRTAVAAGARTANGLSMLLHQGARALELWTKRKAPVVVMRRALEAAVYGAPR